MIAYLDHNATAPLLPEVRAAMAPWWEVPANASSAHRFGQAAAAALDRARAQVAALLDADPAGVVFTSGATEAAHLYLHGVRPRRVGVSGIEHPAVRAAASAWAGEVVDVAVGSDGRMCALADDVDLLCWMAVNHETGVVQADALGRAPSVLIDATQAVGRVALAARGAGGVILSAHKLGGPVGIGALVLPSGASFPALIAGGSQERGRRGGTVAVVAAVGFGVAAEVAKRERAARVARWTPWQARIDRALLSVGAEVIGAGVDRVANTTLGVFPDLPGEVLVASLDLQGIAVSSGAACASGSLEASAVLRAMGHPHPGGGVRVSVGATTREEEVEAFERALPGVVAAARAALG